MDYDIDSRKDKSRPPTCLIGWPGSGGARLGHALVEATDVAGEDLVPYVRREAAARYPSLPAAYGFLVEVWKYREYFPRLEPDLFPWRSADFWVHVEISPFAAPPETPGTPAGAA